MLPKVKIITFTMIPIQMRETAALEMNLSIQLIRKQNAPADFCLSCFNISC